MATFSLLFVVVAFFLSPPRAFFVASLEYELEEELPVDRVVGNIKRDFSMRSNYSDATLARLRYRFQSPSSHFRLESETGLIRIASVIDRDELCPFDERCVISCDVIVEPIEFYDIVVVAYVIVDVNDNSPTFPTATKRLEISEATRVGRLFPLPTAEDADGEEFRVKGYSMDTDHNSTFDLVFVEHSDELRLRLKKPLDREKVSAYSMRIVAADGGSPPKTAALDLEIVVKDDNDNPPRLYNENYEATLEENLPVGTRILQVKASDPDEGRNGNLTYFFTDDTQQSHGDVFGIHRDGWIHVTGVIDYEMDKSLVLTIVVSDQGVMPLSAYAKVAIYVSDVNDNAPVIRLSNLIDTRLFEAEVHENRSPGAFVAHIEARDADGSDNGRVTCHIDNPRFRLETISSEEHSSEYQLVSADVFDREEGPHETLAMSCSDRGQPQRSSSIAIGVWIVDENDNTPRFLEDEVKVRVRENNLPGTQIAVFNISDLDEGLNGLVDFSVEAVGSSSSGAVTVSDHGVVTANTVFDYEQHRQYSFLVVATDRGVPSRSSHARLEIEIEDTNDERPTFEVDSYIFRTRENLPPGTLVGKVRAFDDDLSPNFRRIYYSFVEDQQYLSISPGSGEVVVVKQLDREDRSSLEVKVRASNDPDFRSTGAMSSEVNVRLYVEDENDNSPTISFPNSLNRSLTLRNEVKVGDRVGRIEAFDLDEGVNAELAFAVNETGDEAVKFFGVEASTGWIVVADGYERQTFSEMGDVRLVVRVSDHGRPPRSSTETLVLVAKGWEEDEIVVELLSVDLFETSTMLIAVGVGCGALAIVVILIVVVICFRFRRCKVKNRHSYNCRLEANKATSSCSLHGYADRRGENAVDDGSTSPSPPPGDGFRCNRGSGKKGVRFNLDQKNSPSISFPITDAKISCPFPEECAFHRHDTPSSTNSSPSSYSLHELLCPAGADGHPSTGTWHRPCHEPLARYQRQIQPVAIPQRTLRKVDIPTIDQILFNRSNIRQVGSAWTPSSSSFPVAVRPSSSGPERWSNGSLPDSGQGPSDGEESGVFYPGSQEPFFPAESNV